MKRHRHSTLEQSGEQSWLQGRSMDVEGYGLVEVLKGMLRGDREPE